MERNKAVRGHPRAGPKKSSALGIPARSRERRRLEDVFCPFDLSQSRLKDTPSRRLNDPVGYAWCRKPKNSNSALTSQIRGALQTARTLGSESQIRVVGPLGDAELRSRGKDPVYRRNYQQRFL
jgi:hypothetical protein